ncbi:hypothetical protein GCM10009560_63140 [Nonomuraea longicatena]|uniref:Uncharacterized protein n=1 Tax=Nonomuraea longicatena TaxID=83682 RepID=A0ABN1QTF3_9ACTN
MNDLPPSAFIRQAPSPPRSRWTGVWLALAFAGTLGFGCGAGFSLAQPSPPAPPGPKSPLTPPTAPSAVPGPISGPESPITPHGPAAQGAAPHGSTSQGPAPRGSAAQGPAPQAPAARRAVRKPAKARPGKADSRLRTVLRPTPARTRRTPLKELRAHPLRKMRFLPRGLCDAVQGRDAWWCERVVGRR